MKLVTSAGIALFAVATLALGPVSANATPVPQTAAAKMTDSQLADKVNSRIDADASLKKFDIDASANAGVVTLKGTVATAAQKARAERDAKLAGAAKVDNLITLDKDAGKGIGTKTKETTEKAAEKTKEGVETAGAKTKEAAKTTGEKSKDAVSKTGEVINDAWITTKIKTDFVGEDLLKGSDINVDTANHVVTLKGTVKTAAGRERAVAIAKRTDGVNKVVDQLTIK
jgi:hyperosmotically inducible periplasmic protein